MCTQPRHGFSDERQANNLVCLINPGNWMPIDIFHGVLCVLLDIDGTLVDSNEFHVKAWDEAFRRFDHVVSTAAIREQIGKGADQLIPALLSDVAAAENEAISGAHDEIFRSHFLDQVRAFDGARDFVACLHRRAMKVVLASSAKRIEVDHYIELLDIEDFLAASTSADDVERSKPAGDLFAAALSKVHSTTPDQALAIGDTPYDIIAAAKCGIATLAVLSGGYPEALLRSAGARAIYSSVDEVLSVIEPR
jgi:HAD superfamily hydrolase (TIGR01509 family)